MKTIKRVLLFLILIEIILLSSSLNIVRSKTQIATEIIISNNREPRVLYKDNDKNYFIIFIHDNAGIKLDKTSVTVNGKKYKLELIKTSGKSGDKKGVYDKKGKRIQDLSNSKSYKGKRYDYGIKIKNSNLSIDYNNEISVVAYDYGGDCYLKEAFRVKRLPKADSKGVYYKVDRAPRATTKIINSMLNINAVDYSGIKNLKIYSDKTNELLYSFSAQKDGLHTGVDNLFEASKDGKTKNGYRKKGVLYPFVIEDTFPKEKAKISDKKYKIKVIAEDITGKKSEKNMIFTLKLSSTNSSNGNSSKGNTTTGKTSNGKNTTGSNSNGKNKTGNNSNGKKTTGSNSNGKNKTGNNSNGKNTTGNNSSGNNTNGNNSTAGKPSSTNNKKIKIKRLEFTKNTYEVEEGKSIKIGLKITPSNANDYKLSWIIKNRTIAKISGTGLSRNVTGLKAGKSTTIRVVDTSYPDGKEPVAECTIKVKKPVAFNFNLSRTNIETKTNGKKQEHKIVITGFPEQYDGRKVYFEVSTSNGKIAKIDNRSNDDKIIKVITGDNCGSATVSVRAYVGYDKKTLKTKTVKVKVIKGVIVATSIRIEPSSNGIINIKKGATVQFKAVVTPKDTTEKIVWSTSKDKSIVVDSNGKVTAKKLCSYTTLTVKCGKVSESKTISVSLLSGLKAGDKPVSSIKLSNNEINIKKGESKKLTATVLPNNATNKKIKWSTGLSSINHITLSNKVASVSSNGVVRGKGYGTTEVYAYATDGSGVKAKCIVNVIVPVTGISLKYRDSGKSVGRKINISKETALEARIEPSDATNHDISVKSSNNNVVEASKYSWDKGGIYLKPKKDGSALVTISTKDYTKNITVVVGKNTTVPKVTKIEKKNYTVNLVVNGDRYSLKTKNRCAQLSNKYGAAVDCTMIYASKDERVWNGTDGDGIYIKGRALGNSKIILKYRFVNSSTTVAEDTYNVTVTSKAKSSVLVQKVSLNYSNLNLKVGNSSTALKVSVSPTTATNKNITWSSSNTKVATVNSNGKIEAHSKGTTTITVTAKDGSGKKATCKVTVTSPVTSITLSKTSATLIKGNTLKLTATAYPKTANNKRITWGSYNPSVASVDSNGKVTAKKAGTATIQATASDRNGAKATCKITVKDQKVTWIKLSTYYVNLKTGQTKYVSATAYPTTAGNRAVSWSSSNSRVAKVNSNGKITAKGPGTAFITARAKDGGGTKSTITVKVKQPVTKVSLNHYYKEIDDGDSYKLRASVSPSNASNKKISWSSTNTHVATVSGGKVKAKNPGSATIKAKAKDGSGKSANCLIIVRNKKVKSISVTSSISINKGGSHRLSYSVHPHDATNKKVSWSSRNSSIASVSSSGRVTGRKAGTTWITVRAKDGSGKCARCRVTVKNTAKSSTTDYNSSTKQRRGGNISW